MLVESLASDKFLPLNSKLLEPFDVDKLLSNQFVHIHGFVKISELIFLLILWLLSTLFALVVEEHKLWGIRIFDREALDLFLLLRQPLRTGSVVVDHRQLVHSIHENDDGASLCCAVYIPTLQEELVSLV